MEKRYKFTIDLHMVFIDYKQAYNSINREWLWKILKHFSVPTKLINMIQLCKTMNNEISFSFIINSGLKQGDVMSPVLFNMCVQGVS